MVDLLPTELAAVIRIVWLPSESPVIVKVSEVVVGDVAPQVSIVYVNVTGSLVVTTKVATLEFVMDAGEDTIVIIGANSSGCVSVTGIASGSASANPADAVRDVSSSGAS